MSNLILLAQTDPLSSTKKAGEEALKARTELGGKVVDTGQQTWEQVTTQVTELIAGYLPNVAAALLVLMVGWLLALVISMAVGVA